MYLFRDTVEDSVNDGLPVEAMRFNGAYIEDLISGYRTLSIEGREAGSCEIIETDRTREHGSIYRGKRYGPRNLRVHFRLEAPDAAEFEKRVTALNGILDAEQAELIFHDEQNVYYTGTKTGLYGIRPGALTVTGSIEIHCTDPFKRRTTDEIMRSSADTMTIIYNGTHQVRPVVAAFLQQHTGYIAYTLNGATLAIGDKKATDQTLESTARLLASFSIGSGEIVEENALQTTEYLCFAANVRRGPGEAFTDSAEIRFFDATLSAIAIVITITPNTADKMYTVTFNAYGSVIHEFATSFVDSTVVFFRLIEDQFTAVVGDESKTGTIPPESVAGLTITMVGGEPGNELQISDAKFYEFDSAAAMGLALRGDTVRVDAQNAMITRSGVDMQSAGSIYNDFEGFVLKPGANTLKVECSSWSSIPRTTVRWREAFI